MPFFVSGKLIELLGLLADDARSEMKGERARRETAERLLAVAAAENDTLVRQNAVHRNNAEWLQHLVNTLNQERAERVHLQMHARGEEVFGDRIEALPTDKSPKRDVAKERVEQAVADATSGNAIFEDVGDLAAEHLGLDWAPDGSVVTTKG